MRHKPELLSPAGNLEKLQAAVSFGADAVYVGAGEFSLRAPQTSFDLVELKQGIEFAQRHGVKRVVLGRELSLIQVKKIKQAVPKMEIELFVHGAMCMSYSGRCLLSKFMTDRSANRGECSHPCRWQYQMKEMQRPDEEFSIEEDQRGTYVMNSKDLCMIEHLPELIEAGVDSFKIEGRMKSVYYVALVTKIYREVIEGKREVESGKRELGNVSHRHYCTGFYLGDVDRENQGEDATVRNYTFVGVVENHNLETKELEIKARNYFAVGDELEIIDPAVKEIKSFKVEFVRRSGSQAVRQLGGQEITEAHNQYHVFVQTNLEKVSKNSLLRRESSTVVQ